MYLLIPTDKERAATAAVFTFHNVSINSPSSSGIYALGTLFTFHNVSINSYLLLSTATQ